MNQNSWAQFRRGKPNPLAAGTAAPAPAGNPGSFSLSNGAPTPVAAASGGTPNSSQPAASGPMWGLSMYDEGGVIDDGTQQTAALTPPAGGRPNNVSPTVQGIKNKQDFRSRDMEVPNPDLQSNFGNPIAQSDPMSIIKQVLAYGQNKYGLGGSGDQGAQGGAIPDGGDEQDAAAPADTQAFDEGGPVEDETDPNAGIPVSAPAIPDAPETGTEEQFPGQSPSDQIPRAYKRKDAKRSSEEGVTGKQFLSGALSKEDLSNPNVQRISGDLDAVGEAAGNAAGAVAKEATAVPKALYQKLMSYIKGSDAAPNAVVQKLEQSVAQGGNSGAVPDGSPQQAPKSPDQVKVDAVTKAKQLGGDEAAFGVAQNYRQKYDHYRAFALQALTGTEQKPGNLAAAANAANQMYSNMLDGYSLKFQPSSGGVTVTVKPMGTQGPGKPFSVSLDNFKQFLSGDSGQYDNVMKTGIMKTLAGMEPQRANFDEQSMAKQRQIAPGDERAQAAGALAQENTEAKNENNVAVAQEKGASNERVAATRAAAGERNVQYKYNMAERMKDKDLAQKNAQFLQSEARKAQASGDNVTAKLLHEMAQPTFEPETFAKNAGVKGQELIEKLRSRATQGAAPSAAPQEQAPAAPQPGAVKNGYRFKGGNPADKNSWEPVK